MVKFIKELGIDIIYEHLLTVYNKCALHNKLYFIKYKPNILNKKNKNLIYIEKKFKPS